MSGTTSVESMRSTRLGHARAVARAAVALAVVAVASWALSRLGGFHLPPPVLQNIRDGAGNEIWFVFEGDRLRPRTVLSRVGVVVGPEASLLRFQGGDSRILPPSGIVLVHADRRVETLDAFLPPTTILRLQTNPPGPGETLPAWFQKPLHRNGLEPLAARLDRFWE